MVALGWILLAIGLIIILCGFAALLDQQLDAVAVITPIIGLIAILSGAWIAAANNARGWFLLDGIMYLLVGLASIGLVGSLPALFDSEWRRSVMSLEGAIVLGLECIATIIVGGCIQGWWLITPGRPTSTSQGVADNAQPTPLEVWKKKLAEWKEKQASTERARIKLERDKEELVSKLRRVGVSAPADLRAHPQARIYAEELQEVVGQIEVAKKKYQERDEAIERMESAIRRYERLVLLRDAGVDEKELTEIGKTLAELEVKLARISDEKGPAASIELEVLLERELQRRE